MGFMDSFLIKLAFIPLTNPLFFYAISSSTLRAIYFCSIQQQFGQDLALIIPILLFPEPVRARFVLDRAHSALPKTTSGSICPGSFPFHFFKNHFGLYLIPSCLIQRQFWFLLPMFVPLPTLDCCVSHKSDTQAICSVFMGDKRFRIASCPSLKIFRRYRIASYPSS